jgi:hypothetical protein
MGRGVWIAVVVATVASACGSGAGNQPSAPPCDQSCRDAVAVRALRDAMKLAYNLTLQGKPVGPQDATGPCPLGGSVHVFGQATSNAAQGATNVDLTYAFAACAFSRQDGDPNKSYSMTVDGSVRETGVIAVQPSSTTALVLGTGQGATITLTGQVYAPPLDYAADACAVAVGQNGNQLSGKICARDVSLTL